MVYECNRRQALTAVTLYWDRLLPVHHGPLPPRVILSCVPIRTLTKGILAKAKMYRKICAHHSVSEHYQQ